MAEDGRGGKPKIIHTSYVGTFRADSFSIDEKGVASAILETRGGEKLVKGYNDHAGTLEDAVGAGGETIVRGALLGGARNPHLGIYGTGPERVAGVVGRISHNFDSYARDGKQPYFSAWVGVERGDARIFRAVSAFGDEALALKGVAEGDRLAVPARPTFEKRMVNGAENWVQTFRVVGIGSFEPAPRAGNSPEPQA